MRHVFFKNGTHTSILNFESTLIHVHSSFIRLCVLNFIITTQSESIRYAMNDYSQGRFTTFRLRSHSGSKVMAIGAFTLSQFVAGWRLSRLSCHTRLRNQSGIREMCRPGGERALTPSKV